MDITLEELKKLLTKPEGVNLEFKEARSSFDKKRELPEYCAGIANAGGGYLLLGVNNDAQVVGSQAFLGTTHELPHEIYQQISHYIDVQELCVDNKRIVAFHIPPRPRGCPISFKGKYLIRKGSSLVAMDPETLKNIINETEPDFSAQVVPGLTIDDLDSAALELLREKWAKKANRPDFKEIDISQMLSDLELVNAAGITYAALILLAKAKAITKHLPDAEIIFEWRLDPNKIPYDARKEWRAPYILIADEIWKEIESRNQRFPFQEGFFQREVYAFDEKSIREAVNNAVAHRDYRLTGRSVFIKVSPEEFYIQTPGSFPNGVTISNILNVTVPRNRRLAETLNKVGLVERSGQGLNDIFIKTIQDAKGLPCIKEESGYWVDLNIPARVKDVEFIRYLETIVNQKQISLSLEELTVLEQIRSGESQVPVVFKKKFLENGLIEQIGTKGRGVRYILSHSYYVAMNRRGEYTRQKGLDKEERKELIVKHLKKNSTGTLEEFRQLLPSLTKNQIWTLLGELKKEERVYFSGNTRTGVWRLIKDEINT